MVQHNQSLQWPVFTRTFVAGFDRAMTLVSMKSVEKYNEAVALLCDLREALGPDLGPEFTSLTAAELRKIFPRANGLVAKLKEHGFL